MTSHSYFFAYNSKPPYLGLHTTPAHRPFSQHWLPELQAGNENQFTMAPSRWQFLVLPFASSLVTAAEAYTLFVTNCSVPATSANFVTSPNTRGTMDLLWSSLLTIVACTWTIQHPNVPEQHEVLVGRKANFLKAVKDCLNDAKWMIFAIFAPELIIAAATHDFVSARNTHQRLLSIANSKDKVTWTITHTYLRIWGGLFLGASLSKAKMNQSPPINHITSPHTA